MAALSFVICCLSLDTSAEIGCGQVCRCFHFRSLPRFMDAPVWCFSPAACGMAIPLLSCSQVAHLSPSPTVCTNEASVPLLPVQSPKQGGPGLHGRLVISSLCWMEAYVFLIGIISTFIKIIIITKKKNKNLE